MSCLEVRFRNSDFGAAKLELRVLQINVACLNGMTSNSVLAERHIGSRIEASGSISFTEETMNADTRAMSLVVRDIMDSVYSPGNVKRSEEKD